MQFILTGFTQELGFRVFAFERLGEDRVRTRCTVKADLVLVRADSVFLQPLADPLNALVYSETGAGVETVLVDGRVVLEGGRVTTVDEASIYARAQEAAERQHRASAESRTLAGRLAPFVATACRAAVATPLPFDRYAAPART